MNNQTNYPEPLLGLGQDEINAKPFVLRELWENELPNNLSKFGATGALACVRCIEILEKNLLDIDFTDAECLTALRNILINDGDFRMKLEKAGQ